MHCGNCKIETLTIRWNLSGPETPLIFIKMLFIIIFREYFLVNSYNKKNQLCCQRQTTNIYPTFWLVTLYNKGWGRNIQEVSVNFKGVFRITPREMTICFKKRFDTIVNLKLSSFLFKIKKKMGVLMKFFYLLNGNER